MKVWKQIIVTIKSNEKQINISVRTIPKLNYKIVERGKPDTPIHKYMTTHFNKKWQG
jgi:hypothetical protein